MTLAVALGANVVVYRVLDRLLLAAPSHVERPDEVGRVYVTQTWGERTSTQAVLAYPDVEALERVESFFAVAAEVQRELVLGRGENARRVEAKIVGGSYFGLLGVDPLRGRFFDDGDDRADAEPVAVLGYRFWRRTFGGRDEALGQVSWRSSPSPPRSCRRAAPPPSIPLRRCARSELGVLSESFRGLGAVSWRFEEAEGVVHPGGVEPPTYRSVVCRSVQLS